jgi:transposase-like protein
MQDIERTAKDHSDVVNGGSSAPEFGACQRSWSDEEKAWIVRESFERGTTVEEMAERHGVPARRLSFWRKLARKGEIIVGHERR